MYFRDLLEVGPNKNNGESALSASSLPSRSGSPLQMLSKSPAVREHGVREAVP
jgi:hypothetical protein